MKSQAIIIILSTLLISTFSFHSITCEREVEDIAGIFDLRGQNLTRDLPKYIDTESLTVGQSLGRECKPILNLSSYFNDADDDDNERATKLPSLSWAINDIDMPIIQPVNPINSAFKLLSTFDSQFEPDSQEQEQQQPENVVQFRENNLKVDGFNLTMLNIHLFPNSDPKFGIGITIKNTTLTGRFSYRGPMLLSNIPMFGFYRMKVDNIFMVANSNLTKQKVVLPENATGREYKLVSDDLKVKITNLGYISIDILDSLEPNKPTSNYLLRMLQRVLQKSIKRTFYTFENYISKTVASESKHALDCELTRFTPLLANATSSSSQSEDFSRIVSGEIAKLQLDHVILPDFDYNQTVLGRGAKIQFFNGSISGLSNVKLSGETRLKLQDEHLFANTSIGWTDLKPFYNWNLFTGNSSKIPTGKGFVSFAIKAVDFDAVITKGLKPDTRIVVEQLNIRWLDNPKMDIGGLPGMNRIMRGIINFFMGRLKRRISSSLQPALKQQLEKSLNRITLFNII